MRSYETARNSFGILEFFAKALMVIGVLAMAPALMAVDARGVIALVGALPGVALIAMGLYGQAYVQTARATVDNAEYAQQSLGLAREQFEISKQLLQLAKTPPVAATYAAPTDTADLSDISFDTQSPSATQATDTPIAAPVPPVATTKTDTDSTPQSLADTRDRDVPLEQLIPDNAKEAVSAVPGKHLIEHLGIKIERTSIGYEVAGTVFPSLQKAKAHVETIAHVDGTKI